MCSVRVAAVQSCGNARLILYRGLKSEESLTIDSIFLGVRFDYVAKVIGLGENDFAALREFHSVIEPHLETIVKRVYQKMFDFDWMKRHFVPKHHGFEGNAPESVDNVSLNHAQIHFRRKKLKEYFAKLSTPAGDETFAVLLDVIGHIHTPHKGSPTRAVPIVQITALLGFIDDQFAKAISKLKLKVADRVKLQRAYSKVFWVQNNMFIRHYTN